jgi:hypothetical protein
MTLEDCSDFSTQKDCLPENPSVLNIRNEEELHHVLEELRNTRTQLVPEASEAHDGSSSSSSSLDEDDADLSKHLEFIEELNLPWYASFRMNFSLWKKK